MQYGESLCYQIKELKVLKGQIELSATVDGAENVNVTLTANPGVVPQGSYIEATAISDDSELELMKQALRKAEQTEFGSGRYIRGGR